MFSGKKLELRLSDFTPRCIREIPFLSIGSCTVHKDMDTFNGLSDPVDETKQGKEIEMISEITGREIANLLLPDNKGRQVEMITTDSLHIIVILPLKLKDIRDDADVTRKRKRPDSCRQHVKGSDDVQLEIFAKTSVEAKSESPSGSHGKKVHKKCPHGKRKCGFVFCLPFWFCIVPCSMLVHVDPSVLAFSLPLHRHSYVSILFTARFIS